MFLVPVAVFAVLGTLVAAVTARRLITHKLTAVIVSGLAFPVLLFCVSCFLAFRDLPVDSSPPGGMLLGLACLATAIGVITLAVSTLVFALKARREQPNRASSG